MMLKLTVLEIPTSLTEASILADEYCLSILSQDMEYLENVLVEQKMAQSINKSLKEFMDSIRDEEEEKDEVAEDETKSVAVKETVPELDPQPAVVIKSHRPVFQYQPPIKDTADLPALHAIEEVTEVTSKLPTMFSWRNESTTKITIKISLALHHDLDPKFCSLQLDPKRLGFQYLEVLRLVDQEGRDAGDCQRDHYRIHRIPDLNLFSYVDPEKAEVTLGGQGLTLRVEKARNVAWSCLAVDEATGIKFTSFNTSACFMFC